MDRRLAVGKSKEAVIRRFERLAAREFYRNLRAELAPPSQPAIGIYRNVAGRLPGHRSAPLCGERSSSSTSLVVAERSGHGSILGA